MGTEEGLDGVAHQLADGHRADTAGNRSDPGGHLTGGIKVHITADAGDVASRGWNLYAVDTHIDDHCPTLDH